MSKELEVKLKGREQRIKELERELAVANSKIERLSEDEATDKQVIEFLLTKHGIKYEREYDYCLFRNNSISYCCDALVVHGNFYDSLDITFDKNGELIDITSHVCSGTTTDKALNLKNRIKQLNDEFEVKANE